MHELKINEVEEVNGGFLVLAYIAYHGGRALEAAGDKINKILSDTQSAQNPMG
jgi:hypothetical protein